ncbi:MAG: hypothetical protein IJJ69_04580 [Oscillospiraceae bacterium]|nr:hypothetical protein [Oscillospiraceae bacterium]
MLTGKSQNNEPCKANQILHSVENAMALLHIPESDWADYIEIIDYIKNNPEEFE